MAKKRIAALDLGTNTFHLLIADVFDNTFETIKEEQAHVKLGEGGINNGFIADAPFKRGLDAIQHFKSEIEMFSVDVIRATGTAALRSAKNGSSFIEQVKDSTGIEIQIIDGDLEASLIYTGVRASVSLDPSALIMDIGGGSVEFIFCNDQTIFWKKSYPIGAAKLMARFHDTDPISTQNIEAINLHLSSTLDELGSKIAEFSPGKFIGSAGAFETFAALVTEKFKGGQAVGNTFEFNRPQLEVILKDIIASNHQSREANPLIIPVRTDMIVVASVLTQYILSLLPTKNILLSRYALKEGLLFKE